MSDFYTPVQTRRAAKQHKCVYCGGPIPKGEQHQFQSGVYDGSWYNNRYHEECWHVLSEECEFEFMPGDGEIPPRIIKVMEAINSKGAEG